MLRLGLLVAALVLLTSAALTACAPSTAGRIDMVDGQEPIRGRSLLVVPVDSAGNSGGGVGGFLLGGNRIDIDRVAEWIPLDSLDAPSHRAFAVDALADAVRDGGEWSSVEIGGLPPGLPIVEERYTVKMRNPARHRVETRRRPVRAVEAGTVDAFGPDVDYVLLAFEPALAFVGFGGPGLLRSQLVGPGNDTDDGIGLSTEVVLWDNRAGAAVAMGTVGGFAPIRSRTVSSIEERQPTALLRVVLEGLEESLAKEMPALVGRD